MAERERRTAQKIAERQARREAKLAEKEAAEKAAEQMCIRDSCRKLWRDFCRCHLLFYAVFF